MPAPPSPDPAPPGGRLRRGRRVLVLLLIVALALLLTLEWYRLVSLEALLRRRAELSLLVERHYGAALAAYVGAYALLAALSVPGTVLVTVAGGVLFGGLVGGAAALLGLTLGAVVAFLLFRHTLSDLLHRRAGPRLRALAAGFRADALGYLLFLRLVPMFPFWLVNLAAGTARVPLASFLAGTVIGILPATAAFALFGAGLDSVLAVQEEAYRACLAAGDPDCRLAFDLSTVLTPRLLAALTALGLAALLSVAIRRWRARRSAAAGGRGGSPERRFPS